MMNKAKQLVNMLDFDGCIKALEKIDNMQMVDLIIDRMFQLDEARAIEFSNNY